MAEFLLTATSDFEHIASSTGFRFNQYSESVEWENLDKFVVDDIVENIDVKSLSTLVASILSYNTNKMNVSKKIFQFSQLIIDFLLHYKRHSILYTVCNKIDPVVPGAMCELCGKTFIDVKFFNYYCFRRHRFNSCSNMNLPEDNYAENLKSEVLKLQNQITEMKLNVQNNLQTFKLGSEKENLYDCHNIHKNKLSYNLKSLEGDNPMQTQEMYWQQKYNNLEKNYHCLKNKIKLNNIKNTADFHQQCNLYNFNKLTKYVQTESLTTKISTPQRPPRNIDINMCKKKVKTSNGSIKTNYEFQQHHSDVSFDRDFYELKKLRLEAQRNISENSVIDDVYDPLSCDYVDSIKIVMTIGNTSQHDELFKNTSLMNLIKFDVKELINKRLKEYYSFKDLENDILLEKISNENITCSRNPASEDYKKRQDSSLENINDQTSVKLNKTVLSKIKKKVLRLSRVFTSDSPNGSKETK